VIFTRFPQRQVRPKLPSGRLPCVFGSSSSGCACGWRPAGSDPHLLEQVAPEPSTCLAKIEAAPVFVVGPQRLEKFAMLVQYRDAACERHRVHTADGMQNLPVFPPKIQCVTVVVPEVHAAVELGIQFGVSDRIGEIIRFDVPCRRSSSARSISVIIPTNHRVSAGSISISMS
jgi:hypothetical protein